MNTRRTPLVQGMHGFIRVADGLSRLGAAIAALILVYMVGHIVLEIALRALWSTSTFVLDEFIGFAISASAFMGLAEALRRGKLIRIDMLTHALPPRLQTLALAGAVAVTGFSVGLMCIFIWRTMERDFLRGTTSTSVAEIPLWIPTSLIFVGIVLFLIQLAAQLIKQLTLSNDPNARS
ncbi:MAG: TRAP transporter small permease [Alphaproteobacteria bacterium]|nr:TRAP transporter small permease [Alphaproteobacteria bacterium]